MTDYLYAESNGKVFVTDLSIDFREDFYHVPCIIDTGCINTTISLRSFLPESDLVELKKKDIEQKVPYSFGYGINDTEEMRLRDLEMVQTGHAMECRTIVFRHDLEIFRLGNYDLGAKTVRVSYDRTSPILIGMDILRELDLHIGTSIQGKHILLACRGNAITDTYRGAMLHHFGLRF